MIGNTMPWPVRSDHTTLSRRPGPLNASFFFLGSTGDQIRVGVRWRSVMEVRAVVRPRRRRAGRQITVDGGDGAPYVEIRVLGCWGGDLSSAGVEDVGGGDRRRAVPECRTLGRPFDDSMQQARCRRGTPGRERRGWRGWPVAWPNSNAGMAWPVAGESVVEGL
jgi:hypothetical protein